MRQIKRAAVLGSGVMGAAIAAHLANCGIPVLLLDIVPPGLSESDRTVPEKRNTFATGARAALLKAKPSPLYSKTGISLIEIGNFEDDLPRIAQCDWICEAVKEDAAIKRTLFAEVTRYRTPGSILSTNTSGIPLHSLTVDMPDEMRKHFLGTHFFNPPRYMKLLELISCGDTLPEIMDTMAAFGEQVLGKGIVYGKDTPNFVANRIVANGVMGIALAEMQTRGLTVEEVDALMGPATGRASSALFRTLDIVGLDILAKVMETGLSVASSDLEQSWSTPPVFVTRMIEEKRLGDKTGSGFFKKTGERDEKGKSIIHSLDLDTFEYSPQKPVDFPCLVASRKAGLAEKLRIMHTGEDKGSQFVWKVFAETALFAVRHIPEIADDIVNIDNALKWGYGWEVGIFEMWDAIGFAYVCDRMMKEGYTLPALIEEMRATGAEAFYKTGSDGKTEYFDLMEKRYRAVLQSAYAIRLNILKCSINVLKGNARASLIDLGDGILCAEFHNKMNTIDSEVLSIVAAGLDLIEAGSFEGMVLGNQGPHFTAGANLALILEVIERGDWEHLRFMVNELQQTNMRMRFCRGPVVSAPHHYCFGGGIEMSQHTARVVIAGETYGGLVEAGVGVIPGGGGSKEMLRRALAYVPATVPDGNPFPYVRRAFETVAMAKVSTSGRELIELGYFAEQDIVYANFDGQIRRAKDVCRGLILGGYSRPMPASLTVLGAPVKATFQAVIYNLRLGGFASEHDALVATQFAHILTGGNRVPGTTMTEQDALDLECEAFLSLCGTEKTQQRIRHMLATGKPLRN